MLYATTRNNTRTVSPAEVLGQSRGEEGGLYLPYRRPVFSPAQIKALEQKSFSQCIAEVLNLLFDTELTSWDVDFSIGRYPVRLQSLRHRVIMAECWHNPDWKFERAITNLEKHLGAQGNEPGNWTAVAIRVAVLFGIFSDLKRAGIHQADVSVVAGDCTALASVWYARDMGLPIGNIIVCCNENNGLWELHINGEMRTDTIAVPTPVPSADVTRPVDLERILYTCGGRMEAMNYAEAMQTGVLFTLKEVAWDLLRQGQYVSVVSSQRLKDLIPRVYATHQYLHSPASALAYAGLLDYRAKTGQIRHGIVLSEQSPALDSEFVAGAMGISEKEMESYI